MSESMFEGWHLNREGEKPPYQKPCRIRVIGGGEYVAELYSFNEKYHSRHPVADRWRRIGECRTKKERWINDKFVLMWKRENGGEENKNERGVQSCAG